MKLGIGQLTNSLLSLFLKSNCPLCDRATDATLCQYCQRQLQRCQLKHPSQFWQGELPVFVWGHYGGVLKRAIAALKYENHTQLARPLGFWLGEAWLKSTAAQQRKKLTVIPIPIHPSKRQQRGFNQAELLAKSFCQFTGYQYQPHGLERVRETEAQFGLSAKERSQNLTEAFAVGKRFGKRSHHSPVLILDDIYTTGATARSATEVLRKQGIAVYGILAIASSKQGR